MNYLKLYSFITVLLRPVIRSVLEYRVNKGKEDSYRYIEKRGIATKLRPEGKLVWIHAVSVGESISALSLIERFSKKNINVLITTSTMTSAKLMEQRLPDGVIHQYAPYDIPKWVRLFLQHWQPDMALIMESELWGNTISQLNENCIPTYLINARLSNKSIERWKKFQKPAKQILSLLTGIYAQSEKYATVISEITGSKVQCYGNLKYSAPPPPVDKTILQTLQSEIGDRAIFLAVSTHKQDEDFIIPAIEKLHNQHKDILTVILPRHKERMEKIVNKLNGYDIAIRSRRDNINKNTDVYIVDTMGETGLFMSLAQVCFVGGSTGGGYGGHNSLEPANIGCAIIQGMDTAHFASVNACTK